MTIFISSRIVFWKRYGLGLLIQVKEAHAYREGPTRAMEVLFQMKLRKALPPLGKGGLIVLVRTFHEEFLREFLPSAANSGPRISEDV